MKVFLDDVRQEPDGWIRTKTATETIKLLKTNKVKSLSLDHDLGEIDETGYDVILWIEETVYFDGFVPPEIHLHTDNPVGRDKMQKGLEAIRKYDKEAQSFLR